MYRPQKILGCFRKQDICLALSTSLLCSTFDGFSDGSRGGLRGSNKPPLEPKIVNHFIYMGKTAQIEPTQLIWTPDPNILDPPLGFNPLC